MIQYKVWDLNKLMTRNTFIITLLPFAIFAKARNSSSQAEFMLASLKLHKK